MTINVLGASGTVTATGTATTSTTFTSSAITVFTTAATADYVHTIQYNVLADWVSGSSATSGLFSISSPVDNSSVQSPSIGQQSGLSTIYGSSLAPGLTALTANTMLSSISYGSSWLLSSACPTGSSAQLNQVSTSSALVTFRNLGGIVLVSAAKGGICRLGPSTAFTIPYAYRQDNGTSSTISYQITYQSVAVKQA